MIAPLDLIRFADDAMERCLRRGLGMRATLADYVPAVARRMGAVGAAVRVRAEHRGLETFVWGRAKAIDLELLPEGPKVLRRGATTWVVQPLDVAGLKVGRAAFAFPAGAGPDAALAELADGACEQLDLPLWVIRESARKQDLIEKITRALTRPVFDEALHAAVTVLRKAARFDGLAVVYCDGDLTEDARLLYRVYRGQRLVAARGRRDHGGLEAGLRRHGAGLLGRGAVAAAKSLGFPHAVAVPLTAGVRPVHRLGEVVVSAPRGLDTFGRDLLQVFANAVSQRLMDYSRERRELSQFFAPEVIDELVQDPDYRRRRLTPHTAHAGILYADINSFTKLCERALVKPERIASFVDRWSMGAVKRVWSLGGTFDKMVGDCVIAHFGPPFYRDSAVRRARAALDAGFAIQDFTKSLEREPEFRALARKAGLPGLGVAVGVNLCPASVGLFGPNRDLTAFSRGMNETARLQAQAGFSELVVMEDTVAALRRGGQTRGLAFAGPFEAKVKNVGRPLRFFRVRRTRRAR
ncbi:MAG: adenylate/guanylate cyclase domain-containing protein [Elusimicrobia bacterium]|nr:adenylate/guanylate cyclase domain-containing protein [Elusimicrobiota bacterium]